ncbi:MAG: nucleotide sugar dehydrogenase [Candidatus Electrothrix sp. AW1]|nr:nucleotide sugar dehydrogenase [Candidatus Electrothrix sp. AX1]MCI5183343.1 nucleotide sugar dehydrogenase [Candidatus Electrothrix gigas]
MVDKLLDRISTKEAVIGIVGLGYVGLPLMLRYVEVGYKVIGFDIDDAKTEQLNSGRSYIKHISSEAVDRAVRNEQFIATVDFSRSAEADALLICVPTPLGKHRDPDLTYIKDTMDNLLPHLREGQILCLESTTYPGTTVEVLRPLLKQRGFTVGEDFFLVYSPEREDPGNPNFSTRTIPKVCGADTDNCRRASIALYEQIIDKVVPVSSTKAAEMTKLLENIYRAVNIGLVNELKIVADKMDIDIWEVINAAATKPFGYTPFYPGPGLGGHCIPIDPFYLTWKASEYGLHTRFIELAGEVNTAMPEWVVHKITDALNRAGKAVNGSKILVLGLAYKKNVDDMRESPSVDLMNLLREKGAVVSYSDPFIPTFPKLRKYSFNLESVELTEENLKEADCIVIATDHDQFDYGMIQECGRLVVDTRGIYKKQLGNIVKS